MNHSVLEKTGTDENRPHSHKELETQHKNLYHRLRIGSVKVTHPDCNHSYYCKSGGKKEKDVIESKGVNIGNCSLCWKMNRTPKRLRNSAKNLVESYLECSHADFEPPRSYYYYELESDFYTWLYMEFNPDT